jgi:hypothetical protein
VRLASAQRRQRDQAIMGSAPASVLEHRNSFDLVEIDHFKSTIKKIKIYENKNL